MGTSEEKNPPLETFTHEQEQQEEETNLGVTSNGTHLLVDEDQQLTEEEEILAQQFESVVLQGNTNHIDTMVMKEKLDDEAEEIEEVVVVGEEEEDGKSHLYPLRPNVEDCSFYVKTGTCKFGQTCRFNHPIERGVSQKESEENNGTNGDAAKIDCKYFRTPGGCRYGDTCRYNHCAPKLEKESPELNFLGLPVRPLEQECAFYLRTGSCSYGANCRFHHPDPTAVKETEPKNSTTNVRSGNNYPKMYANEPFQSSGVSQGVSDLSNGINLMNGLPYVAMNPYHQAMPHNTGWNQDQVNLPLSAKNTPVPHQIFNNLRKVDPSTHYEQLMQSKEFPLRPGQLDCDYFMKTGDCRYRAACRFNHPVSRAPKVQLPSKGVHSKSKNQELSSPNPVNTRKNGMPMHQQLQMPNGTYPERPGQLECEFFMKTGNCKFKSACKYHHPKDRISTPSVCALNEAGFPLRPGARICRNYEQQGTCKYGQNCLFHHPENVTPENTDQVAGDGDANEDEDHSSSNTVVPIDLESPSNMESVWGDGWVI